MVADGRPDDDAGLTTADRSPSGCPHGHPDRPAGIGRTAWGETIVGHTPHQRSNRTNTNTSSTIQLYPKPMEQKVAPILRPSLPVLATGIAYYLAAAVALFLTRGGIGIATLWPASGILFAALLIAPRRQAGWHVAAAALASIAANLGAGNGWWIATAFTVANMAESVLAVWLLHKRARCRISFTDLTGLTCFCMAATIATAGSATIAAILTPHPTMQTWIAWFTTDLLGMLVVTPLLLIVADALRRPKNGNLPDKSVMLRVFAAVLAITTIAFAQQSYPLLFLPMLAVLFAAFRLGPIGAAGGVLIVAVVSSIALGVDSDLPGLNRGGVLPRGIFVQFYLVSLFAASLPVAALLAARRSLMDRLAEKMRLLQLAESAANVGHWRLDTGTGTISWSAQVFRIHGIDGDVPPALDAAIDAYHPEDRALVSERIGAAIERRHGFVFTARIVRPDGEIRHVLSRGEIDVRDDDDPPALFGIIQDITAQVVHETALQAARIRAEEAAAHATIMAETDQLTGIANRRRTSLALDEAVRESLRHGRPVSVAMFDIDHFKRINDQFGHHGGDEVLKRVAANAAGQLRATDTLGRFGGEEFVIVLPDAGADAAVGAAERVRCAIEAGGRDPRVTISIGVAQLMPGESAEGLLRRADAALYVAKRAGRNALRLAA